MAMILPNLLGEGDALSMLAVHLIVFDAISGIMFWGVVALLKVCPLGIQAHQSLHMSCVMRKPDFCICENKGADQLCGNRTADQRLCFRYIDSTTPLLP